MGPGQCCSVCLLQSPSACQSLTPAHWCSSHSHPAGRGQGLQSAHGGPGESEPHRVANQAKGQLSLNQDASRTPINDHCPRNFTSLPTCQFVFPPKGQVLLLAMGGGVMGHEPSGQGCHISAASRDRGSLQLFTKCIWVHDSQREDADSIGAVW